MSLAAKKVWVENEVLTATDLVAEFQNIYGDGENLSTPATTSHSMAGNALVLDTVGTSSIAATTNNQIDLSTSSVIVFSVNANGLAHADGSDIIMKQVFS